MTDHQNLPLSRDAIRRILTSLIATEQVALLKSGAICPTAEINRVISDLTDDCIDAVEIDEHTLGFDSLSSFDLILRVNRFFSLHTSGMEDYLLIHRTLGEWVTLVEKHLALRGTEAALTFDTSGSSGPVKHVDHHISTLLDEVGALRTHLFAGGHAPKRVVSLVPPHHIYGFLFSALLPSLLGVEVIDLHRKAVSSAFGAVTDGDLIIATPFLWAHLGRVGRMFAANVAGVSSGGPSNPQTWHARDDTGLSRLIDVYGATETGGIGARTSPDEPYTLLPHLRLTPQGVQRKKESTAPLDIQDTLTWHDADRFDVVGRHDDVIQIAGVNVSPQYVRETISEIDGVAEAIVRFDGARLKAFVVPEIPSAADGQIESKVRGEIVKRLPAPARPGAITFGTSIPRNEMGKVSDWA